jgi:hypothetical protein
MMLWLRWAFIALNVIVCVGTLIWSCIAFNAYGRRAITTPTIWVYVWQLIGVGIVVWCGFSAWHLLWWLFVGYALLLGVVRIMSRCGYHTN